MRSKDNMKWNIIANVVMAIVALLALVPFVLLIISSFTDEAWALANGYSFFPGKFSLEAYTYILGNFAMIGRGYLNTIIVTVIGTGGSIIVSSLLAYALAKEDLPFVGVLNFLVVFTMLFSGGQVASLSLIHI